MLSAGDVLYLELYLRGNAENVLYRFNFDGLSMREDYLGAASKFTARARGREASRASPSRIGPSPSLNEAHFFIRPDELTRGRIRLCTTEDCSGADALIKEATLAVDWQASTRWMRVKRAATRRGWSRMKTQGPEALDTFG